jgi:hypothetical protein
MLALLVVLPTPPLPEVTTMISAKLAFSGFLPSFPRRRESSSCFVKPGKPGLCLEQSVQRRELELSLFQPDLHGLAAQFRRDVFQHLVVPGHRDQLRMELAAEDAGFFVALRAGECAAAQGTVDVDGAVGDRFRAGTRPR